MATTAAKIEFWYLSCTAVMALLQLFDGVCHLFDWLAAERTAYSLLETIWLFISIAAFVYFPALRVVAFIFLFYQFFSIGFAVTFSGLSDGDGPFLLPFWYGLIAIAAALVLALKVRTVYLASYAGHSE